MVKDDVIDEFLNEVENLCRKYGLVLSHEDTHGAFIVMKFKEENIQWLKSARRVAKYQ